MFSYRVFKHLLLLSCFLLLILAFSTSVSANSDNTQINTSFNGSVADNVDDLFTGTSGNIVQHIEKEHALPENIMVENHAISMPQYLDLVTQKITNIHCNIIRKPP